MPESTLEQALKRVVAVLSWVHDLLLSILLTVLMILVAMILTAWVGGGWVLVMAAGILGAAGGALLCKRWFFSGRVPETAPVLPDLPAAWHYPGVEGEFERLHARQQMLGVVLIAALVVLSVLHICTRQNWPIPIDVPQDRLLIGALIAVAVALPLGLLNWRCPSCRRNLGATLSIRQCPRCGVVLRG